MTLRSSWREFPFGRDEVVVARTVYRADGADDALRVELAHYDKAGIPIRKPFLMPHTFTKRQFLELMKGPSRQVTTKDVAGRRHVKQLDIYINGEHIL